jgi:isocitrate dehydrogenase kinase/phosphatase
VYGLRIGEYLRKIRDKRFSRTGKLYGFEPWRNGNVDNKSVQDRNFEKIHAAKHNRPFVSGDESVYSEQQIREHVHDKSVGRLLRVRELEMLTPERFRIFYPQFSEVSDERIMRYIKEFVTLLGTQTREYVIIEEELSEICEGLYTAHMLTEDMSFPITKENIEQGLSRGKYISREHTPEFTVDYTSYNSADDFKVSAEINTKERETSLIYLKKVKVMKKISIFVRSICNN